MSTSQRWFNQRLMLGRILKNLKSLDDDEDRAPTGEQSVFSDEEALGVAIGVFQAYFVEQALFVHSAENDFKLAATATEASRLREGRRARAQAGTPTEEVPSEKRLEIELQTETQISREAVQTFQLIPVSADMIEQEKDNLARLRSLLTFGD
jgi:hypothetical protein